MEGGGAIRGSYLHISATDLTVDDGGAIDVSNGGHSPSQGPSKKKKLDIIIEIIFKSFLYKFVENELSLWLTDCPLLFVSSLLSYIFSDLIQFFCF